MDGFREFFLTFFNIIQMIKIWDILDIAIIAYLIYKVINFLKATSSANVLKGIVLLLAVMWISSFLRLNVVSYLLGQTFEMGIFAVIVIFQPELRGFLEKFGSSNFKTLIGKKASPAVMEAAITQTVIACMDMSKTKTGALIVFERDINLDSYIKSGTVIDAEPSAELIKNIFYPKTPLHDGALIVRDGRLAGAACMLPLSNNTNLSRDLGMRHRAGVGMSERTDAVVAIVSEETGSISVAVNGMLKRHLGTSTFEKLLEHELMPKPEETQKKRDWKSLLHFGDKNDKK